MEVSVTEDWGSKDGFGDRLLLCAFQENDGSLGAGSFVSLWVWKDLRILSFVHRSRGESGKGHPYHGDFRLTGEGSNPTMADLQSLQLHPMLLTCYP